jgi:hypothetical protein
MSGEEVPPQPPEDDDNNQNNDNPGDTQQDFSEPLDPADAVVGAAEPEPEPEPEPQPQQPQLPEASPAETPSTSNNALIMQIKILSEYAKDIKRSMNAVATAAGVHSEYVRRAVSNLVTALVEHNGNIETLQEIYSEGNVAENKVENITSVKVLSRVVIANQKKQKTKIQADLFRNR